MPRERNTQFQSRTPFETFEERLALTVQALFELEVPALTAEVAVQELSIDQAIFPHAASRTTSPAEGHGWQEVAYARSEFGLRGAGQTVVVIDSGIAYDHVALGSGFGAGTRVVGGWDFAENDANPYDDGPAGFHGTHVAGIIGSSDRRYSGVAPGVNLVGLRVFDDQGAGTFSYVEKALQWVHVHKSDFANPITTVNLSLGASWNSGSVPSWSTIEDELRTLNQDGIFVAVSAGNSFRTYGTPGLSYPAASQYVVPVASVDASGSLSAFSQRDSRVIAAPGERIVSTVPDYYLGTDGVSNDFSAASGTSMAAPYVSGASVLVREALANLGRSGINQQTIYDILRNTANVIYDSATQANYRRLNLQRALDTIVGADDFGSTAADAAKLGALGQKLTVSGTIGRLSDQDFFTFIAGQSGSVTMALTGRNISLSSMPTGAVASSGNSTFNVVAGQSYIVGLGATGGIGKYTLSVEYVAPPGNPGTPVNPPPPSSPSNWGIVSFSRTDDVRLASGDAWYQITATRSGLLTVETFFQHSGGDVNLEVYSGSRQLLGTSASSANLERVDISASAGSVYLIRARGTNADVDFRLTNLVTVRGSDVEVFATTGNDAFQWTAGTATQTYSINGVSYTAAAGGRTSFHGGGGDDSILLVGGAAAESLIARPGSVRFSSPTSIATADSVEAIRVVGDSRDAAYLYDSAGNDIFEAGATSATLRGTGHSASVEGFRVVTAYATAGHDAASFQDSTGHDNFSAGPPLAWMRGSGYANFAHSFDAVTAYAMASGQNSSSLSGNTRILTSSASSIAAEGFETASVSGNRRIDRAEFTGLGGDNAFHGRLNRTRLTAAAATNEFSDLEEAFAISLAGQKAKTDVLAADYVFQQLGG
jgi:subtilisin family serine protease